MREIKFRAWNKNFGDTGFWETEFRINSLGESYQSDGLQSWYAFPTKQIVLMQYTGLKDKKGKEIYSKDILQILVRNRKQKALVTWIDGIGGWGLLNKKLEWSALHITVKYGEAEIIGNIYENPDLLEKI